MSESVSPSPGQLYEIRTLEGAPELAQAQAAFRTAMVGANFPDGENIEELHEPGRVLGACDEGAVVGTAESYGSWLTVPGGARVSHAAVTSVGVLPTHTRRGVLSMLMRRQLADIAARGEVVASLRASEGVIYERFGYGVATRTARYEITRAMGALRATVPAGSPVRLVDPENAESVALMRAIYERVSWVGSIGRFDVWWREHQAWAAMRPGPRYLLISGDGNDPDGYAYYHPASKEWFGAGPRTVSIDDFVALSEPAHLGLIRYFAELDLTDVFELSRPIDEPLSVLFTNPRAVTMTANRDETWLRLVDVEAALSARVYGAVAAVDAGGSLVIGVSDLLLTANSGRYEVRFAGGVARTDAPADVEVDVAALASVYLGGTRWADLALAGRALEHRPGALAEADALFGTARAPWAGTGF